MSITQCDLKLENSNKLDELLLINMKNGYKILGYKNDCITQEIQRDGFYEFALYTFINLYLDFLKNAICVDVGANIGCHTLSMARHAQKVICFEPNPQVFKILSQTITLNKLQNVLLRN